MAKLGKIDVADRNSIFDSGAAFKLSKRAGVDKVVRLKSGWEVETELGNPYVVARGQKATDAFSAFNLAYEATQEGLDILCAFGIDNLAVVDSSIEYFVWWQQDTKQIFRVVGISRSPISIKMEIEVKDANGNPLPPQLIPPVNYHESFRYFRLSQTTDDLFDAYRNLWLSFELLLSSKYLKGKGKELDWLEESLKHVHGDLNLSNVVSLQDDDPVKSVIDELYKNVRLQLFHAKERHNRLTPQNVESRERVGKALEELAKIVIFLFQNWLNISRSSSSMSHNLYHSMIQDVMSNCQFFLSDFNQPFNDDTTVEKIPNKVSMEHRFAPELSQPGLEQMLAQIYSQDFMKVSPIRCFFVVAEQGGMISHDFEVDIIPDGIDKFEVQLGQQLVMAEQLKTFYKQ